MLSYLDSLHAPLPSSPSPNGTTSAMNDPATILPYLASTPLLAPFNISKPFSSSQSALLRILSDEILAADTVLLLQKKEDLLHNELQKVRTEDNQKETTKNNLKKKKRAVNADKLKQAESELASISSSLLASRHDLQHLNNFTKSALQSEYAKLVVTLHPESPQYIELERSVDYLFNDEDRTVYFREMIGVLKKIGDKSTLCEGIPHLPLLSQFQSETNTHLLASLQDELWHSCIDVEIRKKDTAAAQCSSKQKMIKYTSETLARTSATVADHIRKHYRKKSIKLHPDRMGEEYRPSFEKFTKAKDILLESQLRLRYLKEMGSVWSYYKLNEKRREMMEQSHVGWMGRYGDVSGENGKEKEGGEKEEVKRLEGGLQHQCLKAPLVKVEHREKNAKVDVTIRVPKPMYEFYSRVRSITVFFKSTHGAVHKMKMKRGDIVKPLQTKRESELILPSQIYVGERILEEGYWDIRWVASLDGVGSSPTDPNNATEEVIDTNDSYSFTVNVTNKAHARNLEQLENIEKHCKVVKGNLASGLHKFNSLNGANRYECHQLLVRASMMHRRLKAMMIKTERTSSSVYDELGALLNSSRGIMAQIEVMSARDDKKEDARHFKSFMAQILESENPIEWMKELQPEDLEEEGGDINRLYQLFIEGKGKCVLLIDSEMLQVASQRTDLFSSKQCKELLARSEAAAVQEAKEEEESRAESQRQIKEEEARQKMLREAELRKKWEMVGNTVVINGLQSDAGATMNGESAKVIYYITEKDRFEVEITGSGKKALLKKENLTVKYFGQPSNHHAASTNQPKAGASNKSVKSVHSTASSSKSAVSIKKAPPTSSHSKSVPPKTKPSPATQQPNRKLSRPTPVPPTISSAPLRMENTLYVAATVTKKLTGKKGRSKKALEEQSGAGLDIRSSQAANGYVPVVLSGTQDSVVRATVLVKNAAGSENVHDKIPAPPPAVNQKFPTANLNNKHVSHQPVHHTPPIVPRTLPVTSEAKTKDASETNPRELFPPGFLGVQTEGFTPLAQPLVPEVPDDIPSQLPSEIGIRNNLQRDPDGSVSSLNDRSRCSQTLLQQHFPLPENDPLLQFLRTQQNCIKGSADEFFLWLVKSEDVDTIASLKEAVSDEEYLAETMKNGNGTVGLKGFKRKAFQRAVLDHQESKVTDMTASTASTSGFVATDASVLGGIENNAFLPSFLYSDFENAAKPNGVQQSKPEFALDDDDSAPPELKCPITHELMTEDPVLAADGVTYERSAIENWFRNQVAQLQMADDQLRANPHLRREQELIRTGVISPLYGTPIRNLTLTPNTSVRNMARAHRDRTTTAFPFGATAPSPSNISMFRFAI